MFTCADVQEVNSRLCEWAFGDTRAQTAESQVGTSQPKSLALGRLGEGETRHSLPLLWQGPGEAEHTVGQSGATPTCVAVASCACHGDSWGRGFSRDGSTKALVLNCCLW